jgi:transcription initiation protein SPT3
MMFTAGETTEVPHETTTLIEAIVKEQVIETLVRCSETAARRGVRSISTDDLIFLYRHDRAKVSRLVNFLSWKDVRKTAKDSEEKTGAEAELPIEDGGQAALMNDPRVADGLKRNKKSKVKLPWDINSYFGVEIPERDDEEDQDEDELNRVLIERLRAADERTKDMTREEYVHWSECRQASFTFRKAKKFKDWAMVGHVTDGKPNDDVIDILGFLTCEIVVTLTQEALLVKQKEDKNMERSGENTQKGKKRKAIEMEDLDGADKENKNDGTTNKDDKVDKELDKDKDKGKANGKADSKTDSKSDAKNDKDDDKDDEDDDGGDEEDEEGGDDDGDGGADNNTQSEEQGSKKKKVVRRKRDKKEKKLEGLFKNADPDRTPLQPSHIREAYRVLKSKQTTRMKPMLLFSRRVVKSRLALI